jgi:arsenite-transporting ATPase
VNRPVGPVGRGCAVEERQGRGLTRSAFLDDAPRNLFFTGKGGVGKTSLSCAVAQALSRRGKSVLLVSTDPASNLEEVLGTGLSGRPSVVPGEEGLRAMNIDPEEAAREYRERLVGPYRDILPPAAVTSMEEQLSGACTLEIAAFNEFSRLLGDPETTTAFDHVVYDTAPTGHTLRLLELPAAWNDFLEASTGGTSCLGPLSGLKEQKALYEATFEALSDPARTLLVLVARPETASLAEAERTRDELAERGVRNQALFLNGLFRAVGRGDPVAEAFEEQGQVALAAMPAILGTLPRLTFPLLSAGSLGRNDLSSLWLGNENFPSLSSRPVGGPSDLGDFFESLSDLLDGIAPAGKGLILTMGKGGVGKTTVAQAVAVGLALRGHPVRLSTTDPAAHLSPELAAKVPNLRVGRIDPVRELAKYTEEVMEKQGAGLDPQARALLEEDLRSPCTEEIAVFRAFAETVEVAEKGFVVLDTAPTGHTLLLLDATESYHKQVSRTMSDVPDAVRKLLPRLRDDSFARVLVVALPEATPVHEAAQLQKDLNRAGIRPYAWVLNRCLSTLALTDPILSAKSSSEGKYLDEVQGRHASKAALVPWTAGDPTDPAYLASLLEDTRRK